jgi:predicted adenylyl cyclase CyaB
MQIVIVEIKARCENPAAARRFLKDSGARFVGEDHQVDTYFRVSEGRLKLREGRIENALIRYRRPNGAGPKRSDVILYKTDPDSSLKELLLSALEVRVRVEKRREIWFIDNVKFHIDRVSDLGSFVEIEAISEDGRASEAALSAQCEHFMVELGVRKEELVSVSYADLLEAPGSQGEALDGRAGAPDS